MERETITKLSYEDIRAAVVAFMDGSSTSEEVNEDLGVFEVDGDEPLICSDDYFGNWRDKTDVEMAVAEVEERIAKRFPQPEPEVKPIIITVKGGLVQHIEKPDGFAIPIIVRDFDQEGNTSEEIEECGQIAGYYKGDLYAESEW